MYFIDICEKLLLEDNNYRRLLFLNLNKLRCKLYFKQCDECFDLARSIMYILESFNMSKTKEMLFSLYYYFTCLLITKDYNRIVDEVEKVFNITLSIYAVYQIALMNPKLLLVGVFMVLEAILSVVVTILHTILWRCKECGRWLGKGLSHKFCPYCGAKVDSESEE